MKDKYDWFDNYSPEVKNLLEKLAALIRQQSYSNNLDFLEASEPKDGKSRWIRLTDIKEKKNFIALIIPHLKNITVYYNKDGISDVTKTKPHKIVKESQLIKLLKYLDKIYKNKDDDPSENLFT